MEIVSLFSLILIFWLIEPSQANFNMLTSKKYDHYFFDIYQTEFQNHLIFISKNPSSEAELTKFARQANSAGFVKRWADFDGWNIVTFKPLQKHFLFAVRAAKEIKQTFPLLIFMYVKHQAFLHAITYMNGAILLPGNDQMAIFCNCIASQLLNFSDVGTADLLKKIETVLEIKFGQKNKFTIKILHALNTWATAAKIIGERFERRMRSEDSSKNSLNDMAKLYQKLCDDQDEIMIESKKAMLSLFEGIKQSVVEPNLPPLDRLKLNFTAAYNMWEQSERTWEEYFKILEGELRIKEMIMEYDMIEMRFNGELQADNEQELKFENLRSMNSLIFHGISGVIELAKINKENDTTEQGKDKNKEVTIIELEDSDQDET